MKCTASSVVAMYNRTKCLFIETGLVKLFTSMWKISHFIRSDIFQIIPLKSSFQGKTVFWELKDTLVSIPSQIWKQNKIKNPQQFQAEILSAMLFFFLLKKMLKKLFKAGYILKNHIQKSSPTSSTGT